MTTLYRAIKEEELAFWGKLDFEKMRDSTLVWNHVFISGVWHSDYIFAERKEDDDPEKEIFRRKTKGVCFFDDPRESLYFFVHPKRKDKVLISIDVPDEIANAFRVAAQYQGTFLNEYLIPRFVLQEFIKKSDVKILAKNPKQMDILFKELNPEYLLKNEIDTNETAEQYLNRMINFPSLFIGVEDGASSPFFKIYFEIFYKLPLLDGREMKGALNHPDFSLFFPSMEHIEKIAGDLEPDEKNLGINILKATFSKLNMDIVGFARNRSLDENRKDLDFVYEGNFIVLKKYENILFLALKRIQQLMKEKGFDYFKTHLREMSKIFQAEVPSYANQVFQNLVDEGELDKTEILNMIKKARKEMQ